MISQVTEDLQRYKEEQFPDIDATVEKFSRYAEEMEATTKRAGYTTTEQQSQDKKAYETFVNKTTQLAKEMDLTAISQSLQNPTISSGEELEDYFRKVNVLIDYDQTCKQLKGANVEKYENLLGSFHTITGKYGKENIVVRGNKIDNYTKSMEDYKNSVPGVNWGRYEKYSNLFEKSDIAPYLQSKGDMYQLFTAINKDPTDEANPFHGLREEKIREQQKQARADELWNRVKVNCPKGYQVANFSVSARNGLVDATIGTGTSLGLMIKKIYTDDDKWFSEVDRQQQWTNFLKIGQSSVQMEKMFSD